jgi:glyoxylate/hydroxypyruvate reductase
MPDPNRRVRLHIQNLPPADPTDHIPDRNADDAFMATPERYAEACARHPDLARHLDTTISNDMDEFHAAMADAEVVFSKTKFLRENFPVPHAPNLKWVFVTSVGVDTLVPTHWLPPGAVLVNNRGTHAKKGGEYAATALLMIANRIPFYVTRQRQAHWCPMFFNGIAGQTLVVVGVGTMGGAAAEQAKRLGMYVIGVDVNVTAHPYVDEMVGPGGLDAVLPRADILLVNVPLTRLTRGLIGRQRLDLLKPEAGLINVARGGIVDQDALADKLDKGELSGAVLDVFEPEPLPPESRLWSTPNLIMTPHVSIDDAAEYIPRSLDVFFDNLRCYLAGEPLPNLVDSERGY